MIDFSSQNSSDFAKRVNKDVKKSSSEISDSLCSAGVSSAYQSRDELLDNYDNTLYCVQRRIRAAVNYRDRFIARYRNHGSAAEIDNCLIFSNSAFINGGYNSLDKNHEITLSAAIWILDTLTIQGNIKELYQYLPEEKIDRSLFPPVFHCMYDADLIYATAYILLFRNKSGYDGIPAGKGTLVTDKKSSYKPRENFEKVMSLIDKDNINAAVTNYENKVFEFFHDAFFIISHLEMIQSRNQEDDENSTMFYFTKIDIDEEESEPGKGYKKVSKKEKLAADGNCILLPAQTNHAISFLIDDPFELAFALLYLLDTDSDIPWLYYGSICVAYAIKDQLPFRAERKQAGGMEKNEDFFGSLYGLNRSNSSAGHSEEKSQQNAGTNLSQLLYATTSSLYPRISYCTPELNASFNDYGIKSAKEKAALSLLINQINVCNLSQKRSFERKTVEELPDDTDDEELLVSDDINTEAEKEAELEDLKKQLQSRQEEIKQLKNALSEEGKRNRENSRKLDTVQRENEMLIRELTDLRNLAFNRDNGLDADEKEENEPSVKFPVTLKRKIVSFGGHPSWLTEMRKLLPDVTFCSTDNTPNIDLLRDADEVWIQITRISHKAYRRIMNNINQDHTQVHYFLYTSANKCAVQMATAERN